MISRSKLIITYSFSITAPYKVVGGLQTIWHLVPHGCGWYIYMLPFAGRLFMEVEQASIDMNGLSA